MSPTEQRRLLASVLNGTIPVWTNGTVHIEYLTALGTWSYMTPDGVGTTAKWEDVLIAVFPHISHAA